MRHKGVLSFGRVITGLKNVIRIGLMLLCMSLQRLLQCLAIEFKFFGHCFELAAPALLVFVRVRVPYAALPVIIPAVNLVAYFSAGRTPGRMRIIFY